MVHQPYKLEDSNPVMEAPLPSTQQALEALYQLAAGVSQEICTFQPDLLVSLAHSDLGPLHATRTYWEQTQSQPFPPCIRINLGVEKNDLYEAWRIANGYGGYDRQVSSAADCYHCMAWFYQNTKYQSEFQSMLNESAAREVVPQRILILDEISHGQTRDIAFGLLSGLYPTSELHFICGVQDWTNALEEEWLNTFYPEQWQKLQKQKTENNQRRRFPTEMHAHLKQIAVGTEDMDADSLHFRPIQEGHLAIQKLAEQGIRAQDSLACSQWICSRITEDVNRRLSEQNLPVSGTDQNRETFRVWPMLAKDRIWIEIWTRDGISVSRWAELAGITRTQAGHQIRKHWQFYQELQPAGFGAQTRYCVDAIYLPEPSEDVARNLTPFLVLPGGRILAQGSPEWDIPSNRIFEADVDWILDLTTTPGAPESEHSSPNRNPDWTRRSYYDSLQRRAAEAGREIAIHNFPIPPYTTPTVEQMATILDRVDRALAEGRKILIHDLRGNERAGLVLACHLIRHGQQPRTALAWLNRALKTTLIRAYRIPGTEAQYRFALGWKIGQ